MGFLDKTNRDATPGSVIRRSLVSAGVGAAIYVLVTLARRAPDGNWLLGLCLWTLLCAFVGAVFEWQWNDDLSKPPRSRRVAHDLPPRGPWWKRKRWVAAAVAWLVLPSLYLASEGPGIYLVMRGWLPASAFRAAMTPVAYVEPWLPDAANELRVRWIGWWLSLL